MNRHQKTGPVAVKALLSAKRVCLRRKSQRAGAGEELDSLRCHVQLQDGIRPQSNDARKRGFRRGTFWLSICKQDAIYVNLSSRMTQSGLGHRSWGKTSDFRSAKILKCHPESAADECSTQRKHFHRSACVISDGVMRFQRPCSSTAYIVLYYHPTATCFIKS
jgi:hypothetical protein